MATSTSNSLTNIIGSLNLNSCINIRYIFDNCNSNIHIHFKNVPSSLDFFFILWY